MDPSVPNQADSQPIIPATPPMESVPHIPPPSVKKSNGVLIAGIVLLVLSLVSISAYFAFQYYQLKNQTMATPSPVAVATPAATADPTSGWKTYTDPKGTFTLKYPANFDSTNCGISGPAREGATNLICLDNPITTQPGSDKPFDGFAIYTQNYGQQSFQTYIENEKKLQLGWKSSMGNGQSTPGTQTTLTVAGKEAIVLNNYSWDSIERIYLDLSNSSALIIARIEESKGSFTAFNQILSTFKFTDQKSVPTPTSEQTYKCPANGWVDCMPVVGDGVRWECTAEAINWYHLNCPNFKGIAQ